jgi:sensor domain CHASE-containing protein
LDFLAFYGGKWDTLGVIAEFENEIWQLKVVENCVLDQGFRQRMLITITIAIKVARTIDFKDELVFTV